MEVSPSFHVIRVSLNSRKIYPLKLVLGVPLLQYIKTNKQYVSTFLLYCNTIKIKKEELL